MGGTTAREAVTPAQTTGEFSQNFPMPIWTRTAGVTNPELTRSPNDRDGTTTQSTARDGGLDVRGGSNAGAYIVLAVGCVVFVVCTSVIVVCLLKRHKRSTDNYNKEHENSQGSNHLVLGELENSQAGQAALNVVDSSAEYAYCAVEGREYSEVDAGHVSAPTQALVKTRQAKQAAPKAADNSAEYSYCAVEGKGIPVDAGYVNAPNQAPVKTRQAQKAAPKSVDTSAEYAYCAVEGREYSEVDAGHVNAPTPAPVKTRQVQKAAPKSVDNSAEYTYCAVEGKGIPVDAGYVNAPTPAVNTRQAEKAAPNPGDNSAEYAYCAVQGRGIREGSVDAEAGYLLPNPAPIKTSVNI
ncbi:uncharacterized protein LOC119728146 [Patiria miniata]|uniref:Uncharacterized protein n=1 Tax=Patiria miniata TaxID=46514 RepID=A0A913ZYK0_PATMI|nr:uncharacterized protein LOC119728146 [Patiria miniata]